MLAMNTASPIDEGVAIKYPPSVGEVKRFNEMQMTNFLDAIGASRRDVENWTSRLDLSTEFAGTRAGAARQYSKENVVELAMISALTRSGCPLRSAAAYTAMVLRNYRSDTLRDWIVFPAQEFTSGISTNEPKEVDILALAQKSAVGSVTSIHVKSIIQKIDELFNEDAKL